MRDLALGLPIGFGSLVVRLDLFVTGLSLGGSGTLRHRMSAAVGPRRTKNHKPDRETFATT